MFHAWLTEKVSKPVAKIGAIIKVGLSIESSIVRKQFGIKAAVIATIFTNVDALKKSSRFIFL